jgi:ketosteroid isomerase-like protein
MRISRFLPLFILLVGVVVGASCRSRNAEDPAAVRAAVQSAHDGYVAAINANKVNTWLGTLTSDVVYMVPNHQPIVGKESVATWAGQYLYESTTHWTKTLEDLTVAGDWAFGRYAYTVTDTVIIRDSSVDGGGTANDSGWGFVVYHHDSDGAWRVARDGWGSSRPAR